MFEIMYNCQTYLQHLFVFQSRHFLTPHQQLIVNDKLLHSSPVAQQSYMATTDAAVTMAASLVENVVFTDMLDSQTAEMPTQKNVVNQEKPVKKVKREKATLKKVVQQKQATTVKKVVNREKATARKEMPLQKVNRDFQHQKADLVSVSLDTAIGQGHSFDKPQSGRSSKKKAIALIANNVF